MKRIAIALLLCLFALLLIAARPRPCKTRGECFFRSAFTATPTATQISGIEIESQVETIHQIVSTPQYNLVCSEIIYVGYARTCKTWVVPASPPPPLPFPPTGYPLPATAPPAGYP